MRNTATAITGALLFSTAMSAAPSGDTAQCPAISSIRIMPFRGEFGVDAAYDRLRSDACERAVRDALLSLEPMPDPRQTAPEEGFVVADAAFFILWGKYQFADEDLFPADVAAHLNNIGISAFFEHVRVPAQRAALVARVSTLIDARKATRE